MQPVAHVYLLDIIRFQQRKLQLPRAAGFHAQSALCKAGNDTIGGIGVSGAPGGDKDEACANAGLAKIRDRLN
jgi:hypothetical protein